MEVTFRRWEGAFQNTGDVLYVDLGAAHVDVFALLTCIVLNACILCASLYV